MDNGRLGRKTGSRSGDTAGTTELPALWVPNVQAYEHLQQHAPESVGDLLLLTADPSVSWICQEERRAHVSLWSLVTLDEQLEVAQEALELSESWLTGADVLTYQSANLGVLCQYGLLQTFRDCLLAQRMATRFFDSVPVTGLLQPGPGGSGGLMEALFSWEASQRSIPVKEFPLTGSPSRRAYTSASERAYRQARAVAHNALAMLELRERRSREKTVIFFGGGADYVNQLHVIERLRATRPYTVIHVAIDQPRSTAYTRSHEVGRQPWLSLYAYRDPLQALVLRGLVRRAWRWFQEGWGKQPGRFPEVFLNQGLRPLFQRFFLYTVSRAGGALGAAGLLLDLFRPDLVVLNNDAGGRARAIVHAARQRAVPSAQLIHSGFSDLHFRKFSTDQIWVWGEVHRNQLVSIGQPAERILITGNPNYDYLVASRRDLSAVRADVRQELGLAEDELLLLLITAKPPYLLTFVNMERHVADLRALCQALDDHGRLRLVIKPHPRYDDSTIYRSLAQRYAWITVVDRILLDRLLAASDAALMVNVASTGGIEALLFGKPLIWIRPSTRYPPGFSLFDPGVLAIDRRADIAPVLAQFLGSHSMRQAVREQGQTHLSALVANLDGSATERVLTCIDDMVAGRGHARGVRCVLPAGSGQEVRT